MRVLIGWELPKCIQEANEYHEAGPYLVWNEYTCSLHEKANLRKDLESWRGVAFKEADLQRFDLKSLLGQPCLLLLVHTETESGTYCNISAIAPPGEIKIPQQTHDSIYFTLESLDEKLYDSFGKNLQAKIAKSPEYRRSLGESQEYEETIDSTEQSPATIPEDDPPF